MRILITHFCKARSKPVPEHTSPCKQSCFAVRPSPINSFQANLGLTRYGRGFSYFFFVVGPSALWKQWCVCRVPGARISAGDRRLPLLAACVWCGDRCVQFNGENRKLFLFLYRKYVAHFSYRTTTKGTGSFVPYVKCKCSRGIWYYIVVVANKRWPEREVLSFVQQGKLRIHPTCTRVRHKSISKQLLRSMCFLAYAAATVGNREADAAVSKFLCLVHCYLSC